MHETTLGTTGLTAPALGLGCMGLSQSYGTAVGSDEALATLEHAHDTGVRFWDTADGYGLGANERLIGTALDRVGRDSIVLATKFGAVFDADGAPTGIRGDAAHVRAACDASLRRLGTDHIDLYYMHVPDPSTPVEETVAAMAGLVAAGKVRHIGLSNIDADGLRAAHRVHPIAAVQSEWSLFVRGAERHLAPACKELGIGVVPYSPIGRGFLAGTIGSAADSGDAQRVFPWFTGENAERNSGLLDPLRAIAAAHGATPAQIALAWVVQRAAELGVAAVPIPGTSKAHRIDENIAALELRPSADETAVLDRIAAGVAGSRRPDLPSELLVLLPDDHNDGEGAPA